MRFNIEKKICFLSNPKSGSTSVRWWLDSLGKWIKAWDRPEFDLHGSEKLYRKLFGNVYFFVTIRNPWAKVVSHWAFDRVDENIIAKYEPGYKGDAKISFATYVDRRTRLRTLSIDKFAPTANIFLIEDCKAIENAISEKLELSDIPPIERHNITEHGPYQEYYTPKLKDLIAKWYRKDIEIGDYHFE